MFNCPLKTGVAFRPSLHSSSLRQCSRINLTVRAASNGDLPPEGGNVPQKKRSKQSEKAKESKEGKDGILEKLDDLNPLMMGRKSRAIFDDVWKQFTALSTPNRSFSMDDNFDGYRETEDFESPLAAVTTVLVIGATGRVGRVLLRKLMLRGYTVKILLRKKEGMNTEGIPQSVQVVFGDLGNYDDCRQAVEGVNKVHIVSFLFPSAIPASLVGLLTPLCCCLRTSSAAQRKLLHLIIKLLIALSFD